MTKAKPSPPPAPGREGRLSADHARSLLAAIDQGFCVFEVIFDDHGAAVDYRFLEANEAFEEHTGLLDAVGKTARELVPELEEHWFAIYGRVATTGEPHRFVQGSEAMGRWFEVAASRVGEPEQRRVALLFHDVTQRKRAEEELRRAYALLEGITEGSQDAIAAQDREHRFTYFNEAYRREFEELWGRPLEVGTSMVEAMAPWPEELDKAKALWARAFGGERFRVEAEFGPSEEEASVYDLRFNPLRDEGGQVVGAAHILHDVTDRVRMERALRASEERSRAIVTSIADGLITVDEGWRITFVNPRGAEIVRPLGLDEERLLGRVIWEAFPDAVGTTIEAHYRRAMAEREAVAFEAPYVPLGRWFDIRCYPARDGGLSLYFLDVTDRKQADRVLRASRGRLALALDVAQAGAWELDRATGEIVWDERVAALLAVPAERRWELAQRWPDFVHPDDRPEVELAWAAAVAEDVPFEVELRAHRLDGEERWLLVRAVLLEDDQGRGRAVGVVQDITDAKATEAELRESDRRKDEYLAMLGHELRNPLAAIRAATELVRQSVGVAPALERSAAVLERQSEHMARLVEGLLDVSRIAQGKIRIDRATLDLRPAVRAAAEDRSLPPGVELKLDLPAQPVWASVDRVRLTQVLDNLLGNAVKFTPAPGLISVSLMEGAGRAVLRVRDTGVGIAPERLERVFEPFFQEEQDASRGSGGLGLGLALAKTLVELHGGTIEAHSDVDGTEMVVHLPLAGPPATAPPAERAPRSTRRRILVVEDNPDVADMLRELLELMGQQVWVAYDGREGLAMLDAHPVDMVLCDIGLPELDGHRVAEAIRSQAPLAHLPLIALSGYGQPEDRARAAEAGFDAHLTKPVSLADLRELLRRFAPPA